MFALGEIGGVGFPSYTIPPLQSTPQSKNNWGFNSFIYSGLVFWPNDLSNQGYFKDETKQKTSNVIQKGKPGLWNWMPASLFCCWCCVYKRSLSKVFFCCCRGDLVTTLTYFLLVFIFAFTHSRLGQFRDMTYTHISKSISKPRRPNLNEDLAFFRSQKTDRPLKKILMSFLLLHM